MGGWGSGRQGGRPLAEEAKRIDLNWMLRAGLLQPSSLKRGTLSWNCGGTPTGWISYTGDMRDTDDAHMVLHFNVKRRGEATGTAHEQHVRLSHTVPTYGGRRWWMHCPVSGRRVAKLYCPSDGDIFACRQAWGIAHRSQRIGSRDRPFEALFKLQRQLGCPEGWEQFIRRPKGMWHSTFARHQERFYELDEECGVIMAGVMGRFRRRLADAKKRKNAPSDALLGA